MPNTNIYRDSFTVPEQLHVDALSFDGDLVAIHASTSNLVAECPLCKRPSRRIHGCYIRTLADLPWCGTPVRLRLRVRKFFCDELTCERKIFAERLPDVAHAYARGTDRQRDALEWIALALGGEAGARLARELGLIVSPDTLLNRIRGAFNGNGAQGVRVVGIDDFAFRKGNAYGTILVDLECHKVVDLLPERSTESTAEWLKEHPGVEVVSRDRSNVYAQGISEGAPDAVQVADRWHLLRSLALKLEEFLLRKRSALGKVVATETDEDDERLPGSIGDDDISSSSIRLGRPYGSVEGPAQKRHERLVEQWKEIRKLHLAGARVKDISEWVGTSQSTVYRSRELAEPPPQPRYRRRASVLDPYLPYLLKRWNEGCRSAKRLHQEIRERGYRHSVDTVNRLLSSFRYTQDQVKTPSHAPKAKRGSIAGASPTAKNVAALFMRREEMLTEEQKEYLERLCSSYPALADAKRLTQEFTGMVRNLEGEKLGRWLDEAESSEAQVMKKFAAGLKKDLSAVRSGLTEEWSNGPVEGFVTKLKLVKRQGYGRANFDILRARILAA